MADSREDRPDDADSADGADSVLRRAYRRLADGAGWLREFGRGHAENSHFLGRRD
ncbi:hypothetical protein [Halorussus halobius]|uniref:hypothetical protein n=1 Tax=Halorussus halobius TaxID=1710537 RepID=UPI00143D060C|nr:hypothetical protein [Halorussus halobius]